MIQNGTKTLNQFKYLHDKMIHFVGVIHNLLRQQSLKRKKQVVYDLNEKYYRPIVIIKLQKFYKVQIKN